jgi:hypothetical protein
LRNLFAIDDHGIFRTRIAEWDPNPIDWRWWYSPADDHIFELTDDCVYFRSKQNTGLQRSNRHAQAYDTPRLFQDQLPYVVPASVYPYAQAIVLECTAYEFLAPPILPPTELWSDSIHLQRSSHLDILWEALVQGSAIALADGSYKAPIAIAGWILTNLEELSTLICITGTARVPGMAQDMDSHRRISWPVGHH